jgi:serine protease AprX
MIRKVLSMLLIANLHLMQLQVFAQETTQVAHLKYRVIFRDKAGSPFSTANPEQFLSKKSLERRARQQVPVLENDLPVNPAYVDAVASLGVTILSRSRWMNAITVELSDSALIGMIQNLDFVRSTSKVAKTKSKGKGDEMMDELIRMFEKTQGEKAQKKTSASQYGSALRQVDMLNGNHLHKLGFRGEGITIAVLDAGFSRVNQIDFFDKVRLSGRILGTRDFVAGGDSVYEDNSHGTSVLSAMAADMEGIYVGTAPDANYWLLRTEDADSEYPIEEDNWVAGAEFADSVGADIINSSLGYTRYDDTSMSYRFQNLDGNTAWITRGADIAASKGMLIVSSAGNSGVDKWRHVGVPADGDSVLSIGAVNGLRAYAAFSSRGPTADGRIKPNVTAMGQDIPVVTASGTIAPLNGTSFSSPVMAGMAACLWQAHPNVSSMQVFKAIEQSADQYEQPDELRGFGIPDIMLAHSILSRNKALINPADSIVNLYPNPFIEGLSIEYYSASDQNLEIEILTASGKRIARESFKVYASVNNLLQLEQVRKLKQGEYLVAVKTGSKSFFRKIIKS